MGHAHSFLGLPVLGRSGRILRDRPSFDRFTAAYEAHAAKSAYNALYDRPARAKRRRRPFDALVIRWKLTGHPPEV